MADVDSRELQNSTRSLLKRLEAGETLTITVDGRATTVLAPIGRRPRWLDRNEFAANVLTYQADVALADDLAELGPPDDLA